MFWVIVIFLALCWLPWRSLWEACHLTGRHSGTPGRPCEWRSGTHMDARGVPKREEPSWAGLLALIMGCPFAFSARQGHGLSLELCFYLPSQWHLSLREKWHFPTVSFPHRSDCRPLLPAAPQPLWKSERQILHLLHAGGVHGTAKCGACGQPLRSCVSDTRMAGHL